MHYIDDHNDYFILLKDIQQQIGGTLIDKVYTFPKHIADGTLRIVELLGNVPVLLSQYQTKTSVTWQKLTHLPEKYTLRFNYIQNNVDLRIKIDDMSVEDTSENYAAIAITTSRLPLLYTVKPNTIVNSINISLDPIFLKQYFVDLDIEKYLADLFSKKAALYKYVPMNFSCRQALLEALSLKTNIRYYILILRTRLFEMTDYFFRQYFNKIEKSIDPYNIKQQKEMEVLTELDIAITNSFDKDLPKLEELAKEVLMSVAKFKTLFKKMYGQSFYDYYNTSKLNKARREIMKGEDSIKEIAYKYGYKDVSNFSIAFKKCFHCNPSELKAIVGAK